ncbi:MAG: ATP-dependent Clp protease ATP-binding subunit ClpX [Deltaproteobacteria bacterium]|nr:ATP-dependent Clp protease ATP-binding subunit ClpX [Deltaproteobacteria bacterium]
MAKKKDLFGLGISCSFCGRGQREVTKIIAGKNVYICNHCVKICSEIIRYDRLSINERIENLPTPEKIKAFLDQYIIGQEYAKKVLSVAVYNHYKRIIINPYSDVFINKSNIMIFGPTGTGKTLLAQTLAKFLNVPFAVADATTLTEAGYVGEDVESMIQTLLINANNDVSKAETGIVYIDEIDKIARKSGELPSSTRDVSGEGVQQGLLKLLEGTLASVAPKGVKKYNTQEFVKVNTKNILFICGGSFKGIEDIISVRLEGGGIGFAAQLKKSRADYNVGDILEHAEVEDFIKYGMIPEFMGRVPILVPVRDLTEDELLRILIEPKNALVKQYKKLFKYENVELFFEDEALKAIVAEAKNRKSGARALRSIMEDIMLDIMFEVPYIENIKSCTITKEVVSKKAKPILKFHNREETA